MKKIITLFLFIAVLTMGFGTAKAIGDIETAENVEVLKVEVLPMEEPVAQKTTLAQKVKGVFGSGFASTSVAESAIAQVDGMPVPPEYRRAKEYCTEYYDGGALRMVCKPNQSLHIFDVHYDYQQNKLFISIKNPSYFSAQNVETYTLSWMGDVYAEQFIASISELESGEMLKIGIKMTQNEFNRLGSVVVKASNMQSDSYELNGPRPIYPELRELEEEIDYLNERLLKVEKKVNLIQNILLSLLNMLEQWILGYNQPVVYGAGHAVTEIAIESPQHDNLASQINNFKSQLQNLN